MANSDQPRTGTQRKPISSSEKQTVKKEGDLTEDELSKVTAGDGNTTTIGSQTGGAGAGKVTFKEF
jgi:hypothetical protein